MSKISHRVIARVLNPTVEAPSLRNRVIHRHANVADNVATEFSSPEAMQEYLKAHPGADPKNHSVKKPEDKEPGEASKEPEVSKPEEAPKGGPSSYPSNHPKVEVAKKHMAAAQKTIEAAKKKLSFDGMKSEWVATKLESDQVGMAGGSFKIQHRGEDHTKAHILRDDDSKSPVAQAEAVVSNLYKKRQDITKNLRGSGVELPDDARKALQAIGPNPVLKTQKGYSNSNAYSDGGKYTDVKYTTDEDLKAYKEAVDKNIEATEHFFKVLSKHLGGAGGEKTAHLRNRIIHRSSLR